MAEDLEVELVDQVAVVRIDRPERRNAISQSVRQELRTCFGELAARDDVAAVVLTGVGTAFCAGGDLSELQQLLDAQPDQERLRQIYLEDTGDLVLSLLAFPKPWIAAVNGPAAGAGCSLALLADLRIASESATFSVSFVRRGLMPDWGLSYLLPRAVGTGPALQLALTAEPITARQAGAWGLVNEVVNPGRLMTRCMEVAKSIVGNAPLAVRATKAAMRQCDRLELERALRIEAAEIARLRLTDDLREGVESFIDRRAPLFRGA